LPAGASVRLEFQAAEGFRFRRWEFDLEGQDNPAVIVMDGPRAVGAVLEAVAAPAPVPRVRNAAGDTASEAVAPGSVASLFGSSLAEAAEQAATAPLPQRLGGTVLVCEDRWLPLVFVSPKQVNFQVPWGLDPGEHKLEVRRAGLPTLETQFTVARYAPGLFPTAAHSDGTPVSAGSPTRPGEIVTVFGTGMGTVQPAPLDGFAAVTDIPLVNPVEVNAGGLAVHVLYAGSAAGMVGVQAVRFEVPREAAGRLLEVSLTAGGVVSNTVTLPVGR
jgi:uncharacterized protein (TIGR03437 family)